MTEPQQQDVLTRLANRIVAGERIPSREFVAVLGAADPKARLEACLTLANAFLHAGDEVGAAGLVERAWWLSGQNPELLDTYLHFKLKAGDMAAVRAAYRHQGMVAARAGRVAESLAWFNRWQQAHPVLSGRDRYEYDADILAAIDDLAAPRRFLADETSPAPGERIRIAHLMYGVCQFNSVIVRIARLLAQYHDRTRFEVAFFVPDAASAVLASPQGKESLEAIAAMGWRVTVAPDMEDAADSLYHLAAEIDAFRPHLLVLDAGLADLTHHYIRTLRPAPRILGFVSGPPAQFIAPDLDAAIAWTWHPLMDTPVPCRRVTLEMALPDGAALRLKSRTALGLPEAVPLLAAGGRHLKLGDPAFWRLVAAALETHPAAWFLAMGIEEGQLGHVLPGLSESVRGRLRFVPWQADYLEVLGNADIVLDTYPSGGGVLLLDAMALGIPVLTYANDYLRPFDQTDWSPAQEFMPDCELVVPRGDEAAYLAVLDRLIREPAWRQALGTRCREHVLGNFGQPARMVAACEAIYAEVVGATVEAPLTAAPVQPAAVPSPLRSNLAYWQQIQDDDYFEHHPCYEGLKAFGNDEELIRKYVLLEPDMNVVEIGCGYGRDVVRIAPLTRHVWGIDVSRRILDKAVAFTARHGVHNFTPVLAESWRQDIPAGIDLVWSIVVFQHLTRDFTRDYVQGLGAKLAPGGRFVCQFAEDFNGEQEAKLAKYEPSVRWTEAGIRRLMAEAGLTEYALDTYQATPTYVWHWACFGRPGGPARAGQGAVAPELSPYPAKQRFPAGAAPDTGGVAMRRFEVTHLGDGSCAVAIDYEREDGGRGHIDLRLPEFHSLMESIDLADPAKGLRLALAPAVIQACFRGGYDPAAARAGLPPRPAVAFLLPDAAPVREQELAGQLAGWLERLGLPARVYAGEDESVLAEPVLVAFSARQLPGLLARPGRLVVHACLAPEHLRQRALARARLVVDYYDLLHGLPVHRLVQARHLAGYFADLYDQRALALAPAVDARIFAPRPLRAPDTGRLRLAVAGDPAAPEAVIDALEALARCHPDWRLEVDLLDDAVAGVVERAARLGEADVLVNCRHYDPTPLLALEAMAVGLPLVQGDSHGGPLEVARDGDNCLLVDAGDAQAIAAAVERLLGDAALAARLRAGGLATAAGHGPDRQLASCVEVFGELLGQSFEPEQVAALAAEWRTRLEPHDEAAAKAAPAPTFSVLVPAYNHAAFLPAALDSLIAQTDPDWEAVVVDDGSTDATPAVLADYAARDARIRVFRQANGGAAAALNAALAQARGEWVCWLSADDLFEPDKLAVHRLAMAQRPDYDFHHGDFTYLDEADGQRRLSGVDADRIMPPDGEQVIRLFRYNYVNGITVAVRRTVFAEVGGFNTAYRNGQDFDMWLRITARHPWVYLDRPLAVTRLHAGQDTQRQPMGGIYDSTRACLDFLNRHPFADLFPGVDLAHPDQATVALRLALELLLDPNGYVNLGGLAVPLAERVVEWLAAHPVAEFRQALRLMVEAERFAGIDFPADLMAVWRRFADTDGPLPYVAKGLLAPLTGRVAALAKAGETERAAELAAYLAAMRGRLARPVPEAPVAKAAETTDAVPAAEQLRRALALHQAGDTGAAAKAYRAILAGHPDHPDALHLLGVAEQQLGRPGEAVRLIRRALEQVPGWPEACLNLGNALLAEGDVAAAETAFRRAIGQRPDLALAQFNLANLLVGDGRALEAVPHYQEALRLAPDLDDARLNLGLALRRLGRGEEARGCFEEAARRNPGNPDVVVQLAALDREAGRPDAAVPRLEGAIARCPGHAGLHHGLGNVRLDQGRPEAAAASFQAALAADPDHAEAHFALAETLRELGREDEAAGHLGRAVALAPDNAAFRLGLCMAALPVVTLTEAEEAAAPGRFAVALAELAAWAATPDRLAALGAAVGQTQPFLLAYREGDHTETLGRYGDLVCRARAAWFAQRFQAPAVPPARPRRRLVVVSGHLRRHSVWDVLVHGVLRRLDRSRFEVIVYHTVAGADGETAQARALADRFEQGPRSEQDWIALMLRDAPDCIWYPEVAMDPATVKLASLRLAPLQVASWGHPITTGLPTIDRFLSGELIEPDGADRHYRESLVRLPGCGACPVPPPEPVLPTREVATGRPPRFLVGQQAAKLSPRFDAMLAAIARGAGECEVIVCRDRKYGWASGRVETRLRRAFEAAGLVPEACLRFVDWRPREAFLALLDEVDVYLDVPAFSGYTTAWLALRRGLPVVTVAGPFMRQRLAAGLLRQLGVVDTVADSDRHYVDLAVRLGADAAWRNALRGRIAAALPALDRHGEVVDALERALLGGAGMAVPV